MTSFPSNPHGDSSNATSGPCAPQAPPCVESRSARGMSSTPITGANSLSMPDTSTEVISGIRLLPAGPLIRPSARSSRRGFRPHGHSSKEQGMAPLSELFVQPIRSKLRSARATSIDTLPPATIRTGGIILSKPLCHRGTGLHPIYRLESGKKKPSISLRESFHWRRWRGCRRSGHRSEHPEGCSTVFRNNGNATAKMLFVFTPAGIEGLFDELAKMESRLETSRQ